MTTTSKAVATATPRPPKTRSATTPTRVAATRWHSRRRNSTGLRKRSGCSTRPTSAFDPRRPSSDRVRALIRLVRVRAVSAMASTAATPISTKTAMTIKASALFMTAWSCLFVEELEQFPFPLLHGLRLLVVDVVHAKNVEDAVHDQQGHLVVVGAGVLGGVAGGHRRAHHHVAQQVGRVRGLGVDARPRPQ